MLGAYGLVRCSVDIAVGTRRAIGDPVTDDLIEQSEMIAGTACARLGGIISYERTPRANGQPMQPKPVSVYPR